MRPAPGLERDLALLVTFPCFVVAALGLRVYDVKKLADIFGNYFQGGNNEEENEVVRAAPRKKRIKKSTRNLASRSKTLSRNTRHTASKK